MTAVLLQNGTIVDGTGAAPFAGHLLLDGEHIGAVLRAGEGELPPADVVLDVEGQAISPGFIDMHSHADWLLPLPEHEALLACMLEQGVTTVVAGNCGISPAPVRPATVRWLERLAQTAIEEPLDYGWRTMAELLQRYEQIRPAVNVAQLVGHGAIRYQAADTERGDLPPAELRACLEALRRALDEGAVGLSFGLGYDPGMYSSLDEIAAFCAVAAAAGKPVAVHLKALSRLSPCYSLAYPGAHNVRALEEMLAIAQRTGISLQLSHFIFVGRRSWSTAPRCLELVQKARDGGVDVMIDAFPYHFGNTTVHALLPYWFLRRLPAAYDSRLARTRLSAELELGFRLLGFSYADMQVMNAAVAGLEELNGLRLDAIARRWGVAPLAALLRLSRESQGATVMLFHTYSGDERDESVLEQVLAQEICLFETDALIRRTGYPNAAALGTFPRLLGHCARDRRLFSLPEGIRRMTAASAARFGLTDRGVLAPGRAADVVVFDPATIRDTPACGAEPPGQPTGIAHVFLNGVHVVRAGRCTGAARAGRVLTA